MAEWNGIKYKTTNTKNRQCPWAFEERHINGCFGEPTQTIFDLGHFQHFTSIQNNQKVPSPFLRIIYLLYTMTSELNWLPKGRRLSQLEFIFSNSTKNFGKIKAKICRLQCPTCWNWCYSIVIKNQCTAFFFKVNSLTQVLYEKRKAAKSLPCRNIWVLGS